MLNAIRALVADITGERHEAFGEGDYRVAAAALLVHVMTVDGEATAAERERLKAVLAAGFDLGPADTELLVAAATDAETEAVDLTGFTQVLVRMLDAPARRRIVDMMWSVVLVDGRAHEFEEAVIARAQKLLGLDAP